MYNRKLKMAELTSKLVGSPYELGRCDCLTTVLYFCEAWGVPLPEEFEGITRETYAAVYSKDPDAAQAAFGRFVAMLGTEVPPERVLTGDFLILQARDGQKTGVAVCAGAGNAISAFAGKRVAVVSLRAYTIKKAYRWRN
ncbi:MAG: hypothetical protein AB1427_00940 [Thermodesulfobacteriota bacterium]